MITIYSPAFIFIFLPAVLLLFFLLRGHFKILLLLIASLAFYFWAENIYIVVLVVIILFAWRFSITIDQLRQAGSRHGAKIALTIAIVVNVAVLAVIKYSDFFISSLNLALSGAGLHPLNVPDRHVPLGLSFIIFMAISYLVDVYRNRFSPSASPLNIAFYLSFFPKVTSGPLDRYSSIIKQRTKRLSLSGFSDGISRFVIGLAKKVLIADTLGVAVDKIFALPPAQLPAGVAWLGIICFTLQLYFDFSGYTDMAIGLAKLFGFDLMENFNYPYISKSIREFWRRWHISLSQWLRDYIYIPLGGSRITPSRTYFNLLIVFLVCGIWHGANWTFILWGLWYALFLIFERTKPGRMLNYSPAPLRHIYALLVIILGWVLFRSPSLPFAADYATSMFAFWLPANPAYDVRMYLSIPVLLALAAGIIFSTPVMHRTSRIIKGLQYRIPSIRARNLTLACSSFTAIVLLSGIFALSILTMAGETLKIFIYQQF